MALSLSFLVRFMLPTSLLAYTYTLSRTPPTLVFQPVHCSGLARTHLAPPLFGAVHKKFLTPFNATILLTIAVLPLCILSDLVREAGGCG
jgi:amino acid transporter